MDCWLVSVKNIEVPAVDPETGLATLVAGVQVLTFFTGGVNVAPYIHLGANVRASTVTDHWAIVVHYSSWIPNSTEIRSISASILN